MEKIYLVTGAAGHLASALLRLLVPTGARVRGLLLPQETEKLAARLAAGR